MGDKRCVSQIKDKKNMHSYRFPDNVAFMNKLNGVSLPDEIPPLGKIHLIEIHYFKSQ